MTTPEPPNERALLSADLATYHQAGDRIELRAARLLAATIREELPDACYLMLDVTDQGGDTMVPVEIRDKTGAVVVEEERLRDLECADDLYWFASCLTDEGPWVPGGITLPGEASPFDRLALGAVRYQWLDLDLAADLDPDKVG